MSEEQELVSPGDKLAALKRQRAYLKSALTRLLNFLEPRNRFSATDAGELQARLAKAELLLERFEVIQEGIDDLENSIDDVERTDYETKYYSAVGTLKSVITDLATCSNSEGSIGAGAGESNHAGSGISARSNASTINIKANIERFRAFLEGANLNGIEVELRLAQIQSVWDKFENVQLVEVGNMDEWEAIERLYFDAVARAKQLLASNIMSAVPHEGVTSSIKLPTIELPKFGGNYGEWLHFHDTFNSLIHLNHLLPAIQKFHYLRSSLTNEAASVIHSLEVSENNYAVAWQLLNERFENKRLIVHNHVKAIFELPAVQRESHVALRELGDEMQKRLRALKSLGQPTEHWDTLLVFLINSKLDQSTRREWESSNKDNSIKSLEDFTKFLNARCCLLETVNAERGCVDKNKNSNFGRGGTGKVALSLTLRSSKCKVCNGDHQIYKCSEFLSLTVDDRKSRIKSLNLCYRCLKDGHAARDCGFGKCRKCGGSHNMLLHKDTRANSTYLARDSEPAAANLTVTHADLKEMRLECPQTILSTATVIVFDKTNEPYQCRALLDPGSMANFISEELCNRLNLPCKSTKTSIQGINQATTAAKGVTVTKIKSRVNSYSTTLSFLVVKGCTSDLPAESLEPKKLSIPSNVELADPLFYKRGKIDMILGAEKYLHLLCIGQIKLSGDLRLQKTLLGWIVGGGCANDFTRVTASHAQNALDVDLTRFWQIEEIESDRNWSPEEEECENHFIQTHRRDSDGRFIVQLPFNKMREQIGCSKEMAKKRFLSLERKFGRNPHLKSEYSNFIDEYARMGHMEKVDPIIEERTLGVFYLPHHAVVKPESTTSRLRVVFDASAKPVKGVSLNDALLVGPVIQQDLFSIIVRFRTHRFVITADIAKMYRQVWLDDQEWDYQRILWRDDPNSPLISYRLKTVTYGTASASFLATRCLKQLETEHAETHPLASLAIKTDFYVDDLLTGADTKEKCIEIRDQLIECLNKGGFELRKWASNHQDLLPSPQSHRGESFFMLSKDGSTKTLGLIWNYDSDVLKFSIGIRSEAQRVTKRIILSTIAQIFDPLGLIGPITIVGKILMQKLWLLKLHWDETVPADMHLTWLQFTSQLQELNNLSIPRCVTGFNNQLRLQIHGFCDASVTAYGACVYIRSVNENNDGATTLLCAKSRVAPLKTISIPRLELCGAVLLARLVERVKRSLCNVDIEQCFYWTDSTIVLAWLSSVPSNFKTFVANRSAEIQRLTTTGHWRHVSTGENPADLISRGATPKELLKVDLWWRGPNWLSFNPSFWPEVDKGPIKHAEEQMEGRKTVLAVVAYSEPCMFSKFSKFNRLQRVMAYCLRFIWCLRQRQRKGGPLSCMELKRANCVIFRITQRQAFPNEVMNLERGRLLANNSKLKALSPIIDKRGLLRVGGRITNAPISYFKRHPIILPAKYHITKLLISQEHERQLHAGNEATLAALREKYWIISGRNEVRSITRNCLKCFRAKPYGEMPIMGNLPAVRLQPCRPFLNTGVDYAGPLFLREGRGRGRKKVKAYIALFICMATKAIHLELVGDLTMESFLGALKRFVSRRGNVQNLYSDNGTTFVGAHNELRDLAHLLRQDSNQNLLKNKLSKDNISWHFIPPRAPHFGGLWEAGVKSVKKHLYKVLSEASCSFEEMYTVLTRIEACLNSRPLTLMSNDPNDLSALTPGHFLIGDNLAATLEPDLTLVPMNRLSRWQRMEQLRQLFWRRWMKEYVPGLQKRKKWARESTTTFRTGTMVVIQDDNLPPLKWRLGRVHELHPGQDGVTRVVTLKTSSGLQKRSVSKLYVLPLEE